jgi:urease alpha subunit
MIVLLSDSAFFGGKPQWKVNMFGIALAVLGAINYSIASAKNSAHNESTYGSKRYHFTLSHSHSFYWVESAFWIGHHFDLDGSHFPRLKPRTEMV